MHDLNPHVINSLYCLGGIVACLAILWVSRPRKGTNRNV